MSNPVDLEFGIPAQGQTNEKNENMKKMQNQVDEVVDIMRSNVEKIMEREDKLTELDERAKQLDASASVFHTSTQKIKRKYWYKNMKIMAILGIVFIISLIIIIFLTSGGGSSDDQRKSTTKSP